MWKPNPPCHIHGACHLETTKNSYLHLWHWIRKLCPCCKTLRVSYLHRHFSGQGSDFLQLPMPNQWKTVKSNVIDRFVFWGVRFPRLYFPRRAGQRTPQKWVWRPGCFVRVKGSLFLKRVSYFIVLFPPRRLWSYCSTPTINKTVNSKLWTPPMRAAKTY